MSKRLESRTLPEKTLTRFLIFFYFRVENEKIYLGLGGSIAINKARNSEENISYSFDKNISLISDFDGRHRLRLIVKIEQAT